MTELANVHPPRKVLSVAKDVPDDDAGHSPPRYVAKGKSQFMVWGGDPNDMPKRVYAWHERNMAVNHAKALCAKTGRRFYVMRAWRAFEVEA